MDIDIHNLLTASQYAKKVGVPYNTVLEGIKKGELKTVTIGNMKFIDYNDPATKNWSPLSKRGGNRFSGRKWYRIRLSRPEYETFKALGHEILPLKAKASEVKQPEFAQPPVQEPLDEDDPFQAFK